MKHIQARVDEERFKLIKKKAIDLDLTVEDFLKQAAVEAVDGMKEVTSLNEYEKLFEKSFEFRLISQPFIIVDCNYRPDFYCPETGAIYEVITSAAAMSHHKKNKHFDYAAAIAPMYIVTINPRTTKMSMQEYETTEEVKPTKIYLPLKKIEPMTNGVMTYPSAGGNSNLMQLMRTARTFTL